ncbi:hypothetical protein [Streptomyces sp. Tue6028]
MAATVPVITDPIAAATGARTSVTAALAGADRDPNKPHDSV